MKFIFGILLLLSYNSFATNYYFSQSGNDGNDGTQATPFKTISKFNSLVLLPGDSAKFKGGDTWVEAMRPHNSGSTANPIVICSYGVGRATITGLQNVTSFTQAGNIWSVSLSSIPKDLNVVLINGKARAKGRTPNNSYYNSVSIPTTSKLVVPHSTTNYSGYGIVVRNANWILDETKIVSVNTGATNDTFNLYPAVTYSTLGAYYFFQNNIATLDTTYEWSYDSLTTTLSIHSTSSPSVQVSTIDNLIEFFHLSNLVIDGIKITGANNYGINFDSTLCRNITIKNCTIDNIGGIGIIGHEFNGLNILNDTITNCLSNGILVTIDTSFNTRNCFIKNIGIYEGMSLNGNGMSNGIFNQGTTVSGHTIVNNYLDSIGANGIYFRGRNGRVDSNFINHYSLQKADVAGLYSYSGIGNDFSSGSAVRKNIVINGVAPYWDKSETHAIYADNGIENLVFDSNSVANVPSVSSLVFYGQPKNTFTNNTAFSANNELLFYSPVSYGSTPLGIVITNNIFYSATGDFITLTGNLDTVETINYNTYVTSSTTPYKNSGSKSFTQWKAIGYDKNSSFGFPSNITSINPLFVYNPYDADTTISLSGGYYDARGTGYENSIVLKGHTSKILFPSIYFYQAPIKNLKFNY